MQPGTFTLEEMGKYLKAVWEKEGDEMLRNQLNARQGDIVQRRLGMGRYKKEQTFKEIAFYWEVSRETIRRAYIKAMLRLLPRFKKDLGIDLGMEDPVVEQSKEEQLKAELRRVIAERDQALRLFVHFSCNIFPSKMGLDFFPLESEETTETVLEALHETMTWESSSLGPFKEPILKLLTPFAEEFAEAAKEARLELAELEKRIAEHDGALGKDCSDGYGDANHVCTEKCYEEDDDRLPQFLKFQELLK